MKNQIFFSLSLTAIGLALNAGVAKATPLNPGTAKALDFTFSFSNQIGNVSGDVTGIITGLNDNATSAATNVIVQNYPSGLSGSPFPGAFDATQWQSLLSNTFEVTNGTITAASFTAFDDFYGGGLSTAAAFCINGQGFYCSGINGLTFGNESSVGNQSGFSGVTFSSATPVPFEFSPGIGILALGACGAISQLKSKMQKRKALKVASISKG